MIGLSKMIAAALLLASVASGAASAQNSQLMAQPRIYEALTKDQFTSMLTEVEVSLTEISRDSQAIVFEARVPTGAVFYVALRGCVYEIAPIRCELVQPYALFNALGVTLTHINDFNDHKSAGSVAFLMPGDKGVVAAKVYLAGGITKMSFINQLGIFFSDVDTIVTAILPGALATVSYAPKAGAARSPATAAILFRGAEGFEFPAGVDLKVNATGKNAPVFMPYALRAALP